MDHKLYFKGKEMENRTPQNAGFDRFESDVRSKIDRYHEAYPKRFGRIFFLAADLWPLVGWCTDPGCAISYVLRAWFENSTIKRVEKGKHFLQLNHHGSIPYRPQKVQEVCHRAIHLIIKSWANLYRLDCPSIHRNLNCQQKKSRYCRTTSNSFAMLLFCSLRLVQLEVWAETLVSLDPGRRYRYLLILSDLCYFRWCIWYHPRNLHTIGSFRGIG